MFVSGAAATLQQHKPLPNPDRLPRSERWLCRSLRSLTQRRSDVPETQLPQRYASITKAICILIVALMVVGMLYAGWIAIANYSSIGV